MSTKENPGSAPGISSGQGRVETTKSSNFVINIPSINLSKGGSAIKGLGEKVAANAVTGINMFINVYSKKIWTFWLD